MEIYKILDEFEAEIDESARIPLTNKVVMQDEAIYKFIDKMRASLPEDIRQAQWIKKERQRLIEDAELEAKKILENAKNKIQDLANESEIFKIAEKNSQELLKKAKTQAQAINQGAFTYADEIMLKIQEQLETYLSTVKEGRQQIKQSIKKQQSGS